MVNGHLSNVEVVNRRRASGLIRGLVVAAATVAILLVCFSIYQYGLTDAGAVARHRPRLDVTSGAVDTTSNGAAANSPASIPVGNNSLGATVGAGRNTQLSIYPRKGEQSQVEIAVRDWIPMEGSINQFQLTSPEIRMRTKEGNAIRVTAESGVLEAPRKTGVALEPQRGRLSGSVRIEIDRLTDRERALLAPEIRDSLDPSRLIRIEMEEIEFDLEYSRVLIPGTVVLTSADADVRTADVEIRFDEAANRVESLRIMRGGTIEFREQEGRLGLSMPDSDVGSTKSSTLAEWVRATLLAPLENRRLAADESGSKGDHAARPASPGAAAEVPVFRTTEADAKSPAPPTPYSARFEGEVVAQRRVGDLPSARLEADTLTIYRDFSQRDRDAFRAPDRTEKPAYPEGHSPSTDRIVLEWQRRLLIAPVPTDDPDWRVGAHSKIVAVGSPTRLTDAEGLVTCGRMSLEPETGEAQFSAESGADVLIRSPQEGSLRGSNVWLRRNQDAVTVEVTGPGSLRREEPTNSQTGETSDGRSSTEIEFANRLDLRGRVVSHTTFDFSRGVVSEKLRVLDRADFHGEVQLRDRDFSLSTDTLSAFFGERRVRGDGLGALERVEGLGSVALIQGQDRLSCDRVEVILASTWDGRTVPLQATAFENILAIQGGSTIRAGDRLIVDFDTVQTGRVLPIPSREVSTQAPPNTAENHAANDPSSNAPLRINARRLRLFGDVSVVDPKQSLELTASELDCRLEEGRQFTTAEVIGTADRPASVQLEDLAVTGERVRLNVQDQWAEVPCPGRMRFYSHRDLDGRRLNAPIPITIDWKDWMKYQGRENRAVFSGKVHATSERTTTFDCQQLVVEFDEVSPAATKAEPSRDWWILQGLVDEFMPGDGSRSGDIRGRFSKEPAQLLATGNAVVQTSEFEPNSGELRSRAQISGPRLSVNLRPDVSKMLMEGAGHLLLEDYRPAASASRSGDQNVALFDLSTHTGPSATLIQWKNLMWYDFSIDQTRFEGSVDLRHLSGAQLGQLVSLPEKARVVNEGGRSMFLTCDLLSVDFRQRNEGAKPRGSRRLGGLSSERLRQFRASGNVGLQDAGFWLSADDVTYERERGILAVQGLPNKKAQIVSQRPGSFPTEISAERFFYNLATQRVEASKPSASGR